MLQIFFIVSTSETIISSNPSEESNSAQKTGELQNIRASNRLNGKNYLKWSQIVRTYLKGKGRLNHLLGTWPETKDPAFEAWDEEDSMIMSRLWDSIDATISEHTRSVTHICSWLLQSKFGIIFSAHTRRLVMMLKCMRLRLKLEPLSKETSLSRNIQTCCKICGKNWTTTE